MLKEEALFKMTDCNSLSEIRVIAMISKGYVNPAQTLAACENLSIAYLSGNRPSMEDLLFLSRMARLQKLDLSFCFIRSLPTGEAFTGLTSLAFFFLHNNDISQWNDLLSLTQLPAVEHLTLHNNPVTTIPGYRHFMVNSAP